MIFSDFYFNFSCTYKYTTGNRTNKIIMSNIDINIRGVIGIAIPIAALYLIKSIKEVACKYLDNLALAQKLAAKPVDEPIAQIVPVQAPVQAQESTIHRSPSATSLASTKNAVAQSITSTMITDYKKS